MTLLRLHMRRFKKFADWAAGFSPGLNVIRGPNEAGKTTVMQALFAALLVDPSQPPATFTDDVRSWGEKRLPELLLEFKVDGNVYLLRKDFDAGTVLLQQQRHGERVEGSREVQQRILNWLGMSSAGAFRSTAFVGQGELARISEDRHLMGTQLSRVLSGGGAEDIEAAIRWINQRLQQLAPNGSRRGTTDERLQVLLSQQRELEKREEWAYLRWLELRALRRELVARERRLKGKSEQMAAAERHGSLRRRQEDLERDLQVARQRMGRLDELYERLGILDAELKTFTDHDQVSLRDLVQAQGAARKLKQDLEFSREQLEGEEAQLEQLGVAHRTAQRRAGLRLILGGVGAAGAVGGLLLSQLQGFTAGWGIAIAGVGLILLGLHMREQVAQTAAPYRTQEQRVLELRLNVEDAHTPTETAERELHTRLEALGASSIEAVEQQSAAYITMLKQHEEVRVTIQQLLDGRSREELTERVRETTHELTEVRQLLTAYPEGMRVGADGLETLRTELQTMQRETAALDEERARVERMLEGSGDESEQCLAIKEQIAALRDQRTRTGDAVEILDFARRTLEEARRQSSFRARDLLELAAGDYLRLMTHGSHQKMLFDDRTMLPRVWAPAADGWIGADRLSQGATDQVYFALRLALLDVLCQGRTPPLFLDEPFVHFDPDRVKAALPLIQDAARQRQIFLCTLWPHDDLSAGHVITLSASPPESSAVSS
jgi:DNA repair exonuclease SbcCD ATPase subunit